jgi:Protein of unknown function (DUF4238)
MGDYKRQHTITEAYLRGFTDEESQNTLWRYDKAEGTCEKKNVGKATVKFHAYSFQDSEGHWNHKVEELFGEIESDAVPLLPKLATGSPLTMTEKGSLSYFIATIMRRPAALLEHFLDTFQEYRNDRDRLMKYFDSILPKLKTKFTQEEIEAAREAVSKGELDILPESAKAEHLQVWMNKLPDYADIIAGMYWQVWKADSGCSFLTSDAPAFVRRNARDDDTGVVGIARADLDAELTFPITKKSLLIAAHKPREEAFKATKSRVRQLNARIVRMAFKHVFAAYKSDSIAKLVEQYRNFSAPLPDLTLLNERNDKRYGLSLSEGD